jgi:tRNA threonylcarbamoyladenosine biosynthesis protein TsaB
MRILAIDTATEACSVALNNDGTLFAHFELCPREHTQRILPLVKDVLTEGGVALSELDALAFGRGPGALPACASVLVLRKGWRWARSCR